MEREKGLEGLQVWQRALAFAGFIAHEVLSLLPEIERYQRTAPYAKRLHRLSETQQARRE